MINIYWNIYLNILNTYKYNKEDNHKTTRSLLMMEDWSWAHTKVIMINTNLCLIHYQQWRCCQTHKDDVVITHIWFVHTKVPIIEMTTISNTNLIWVRTNMIFVYSSICTCTTTKGVQWQCYTHKHIWNMHTILCLITLEVLYNHMTR